MKSFGNVVVLIFAAFFLVSCATPPVKPPVFSYGKDEIHLDLDADARLNVNQGSAHTLLLCVHQLRDPNAFNRLAGDQPGIYKLLECSQFDSTVTHSKRIIVQPDQKVSYTLDRAEGTKYVAVVGGYYNVRKDDVTKLFEIPIYEKTVGNFSRERVSGPDVLDVKLDLGPRSLQIRTDQ